MGLKRRKPRLVNKASTLDFGAYKGKTVDRVLRDDPSWLLWAFEKELLMFVPALLAIVRSRAADQKEEERGDFHGDLSFGDLY